MSSHADATNASRPAFLAFARDAADVETLKAFAAAHEWPHTGIHQGDIATAAQYLKQHPSPQVLLVELPSAQEAPALLDALADVCDPGTKVITIGNINEYSFYCWLMDLGIFSYLLRPLTLPMLEGAWEKSQIPHGQARQEKPPARVIAVMGTRGGVGATTVSINLAGIFAQLSGKQVALVDLDPHEGSVALALDLEPSRGLRDALEKPDRIDSLFIERVMHKPSKHLSVLSAEESLQDRVQIHDEASAALLRELREKFDIIVLDVPRVLNNFSRQCLKQAEHVVLVSELTLLGLRDALRLTDMMRETLKIKPPVIVASRVGAAAKQEMQPGDFEKGMGSKIAQRIAFAPEVFMQVGGDIPAVKNKSHPAAKPLYALAQQFIPEAKQKDAAKAKPKLSFKFLKK